jgi:hypothetical protein
VITNGNEEKAFLSESWDIDGGGTKILSFINKTVLISVLLLLVCSRNDGKVRASIYLITTVIFTVTIK